MAHLSRRYTDYFYREEGKGNKKKLIKVPYMTCEEFMRMNPMAVLPGPNAVFPFFPRKHEKRDFISKKGKKHNHTHARMKRKHKARMKARRCA